MDSCSRHSVLRSLFVLSFAFLIINTRIHRLEGPRLSNVHSTLNHSPLPRQTSPSRSLASNRELPRPRCTGACVRAVALPISGRCNFGTHLVFKKKRAPNASHGVLQTELHLYSAIKARNKVRSKTACTNGMTAENVVTVKQGRQSNDTERV